MRRPSLIRTSLFAGAMSFLGAGSQVEAAPIVITSIGGPNSVFVGELATFNVFLGFYPSVGLTGEVISNVALTFTSGDGESQSGTSATFAYDLPGIYEITVQGSASTTGFQTVSIPVFQDVCNGQTCVREQTGFVQELRSVIQSNTLFASREIEVFEARIIDPGGNPGGTPTPVPEPTSIVLLGTGIATLVVARRCRQQRAIEPDTGSPVDGAVGSLRSSGNR